LALRQGLEAGTLDGRVMHEYILTAILWGDEAVALTVVEPLHCSCNHGNTSVWLNWNDAKPDPEGDIAGVTTEKTGGTSELTTRRALQ
jgi:hypothetical protein